jgi:hypothetical protein
MTAGTSFLPRSTASSAPSASSSGGRWSGSHRLPEHCSYLAAGASPRVRLRWRPANLSIPRELRGPSPSVLERLLVDRIVVCWLALHYAEIVYPQRMATLDRKWAEYYQDWIDRSQKRYLAALKALAQLRRPQLPVVQVNVAEQQVNVGAGGACVGESRMA